MVIAELACIISQVDATTQRITLTRKTPKLAKTEMAYSSGCPTSLRFGDTDSMIHVGLENEFQS